MKLNSVNKLIATRVDKRSLFRYFRRIFYINETFIFLLFSDHVLVGHVMRTAVVVDEFECQLKCIGNNSCKSFNVHPHGKCELNSKTRQMKPGDFQWRSGSTYYGSVQVSFFLSEGGWRYSLQHFPSIIRINLSFFIK